MAYKKNRVLPNAKGSEEIFLDQLQQLYLVRKTGLDPSTTQFWDAILGQQMQNYVLYPTPLHTIEMLDKEGVAAILYFSALNLRAELQKSQKY